MKRKIITIDQETCNGCGLCIPNCPEGAIQIIDGKARLISDLFCDGLGACLGHCPQGAISIEEREAQKYSERQVMENIVKQGKNVIEAHLHHLKEHGEMDLYNEARQILKEKAIAVDSEISAKTHDEEVKFTGCPGSRTMAFKKTAPQTSEGQPVQSQLGHWPVQMHLISPLASHYKNADLLLAADCVAYALGDFHTKYLKGKSLAIACPKLDEGQDVYYEKLRSLIDDAKINSLSVIIMQVPCCQGLLRLAQKAVADSSRKVPVKAVVVSVQGEVLSEEWV